MFLCCSYTDVIAAFETRIDPIAFAGLGSAPTSAERRQLPELNPTSGGLRSGEGLTSPLGFIASGAPAIVPATRAASPPSQRHASAPHLAAFLLMAPLRPSTKGPRRTVPDRVSPGGPSAQHNEQRSDHEACTRARRRDGLRR
jgi:hypothetical protein